MNRAWFTEEQIIGVLKEHEAEAKSVDLARKYGVSEATLYDWNEPPRFCRRLVRLSHAAMAGCSVMA
jgi:Transposase